MRSAVYPLFNEPRFSLFFLNLHTGIGWAEVFKNLLQLRLPVMSASNEYQAVLALQRAGVCTLTVGAYALAGWNPAVLRSMIVTAELTGTVTLEDYCANWAVEPPPRPHPRATVVRCGRHGPAYAQSGHQPP